jgi:hypothetical protein
MGKHDGWKQSENMGISESPEIVIITIHSNPLMHTKAWRWPLFDARRISQINHAKTPSLRRALFGEECRTQRRAPPFLRFRLRCKTVSPTALIRMPSETRGNAALIREVLDFLTTFHRTALIKLQTGNVIQTHSCDCLFEHTLKKSPLQLFGNS